ncbi:MAG TPA: YdeI/OmpD-associated family protein, partial [Microlunatus sp.]
DGQAGKRDESSYTVRITPRRPKGSWSQRNVALVATLEEQGRMTDAGRAVVEAARTDGRWGAAYAGPRTRQAPADLAAAIVAEPDAQATFDVFTSANRFALIHRVESMKRAESRARKVRSQDHRDGRDAGARRDALPPKGGSPYLTAPIRTLSAKQILNASASNGWKSVQIAPGINPSWPSSAAQSMMWCRP